jgi:hypothetical protein
MSEASKAYRAVLWLSEKGLADLELFQDRFSAFMRGILTRIEPERLANDVAVGDQWEELVELELLKGTLQVKDIAEESGGFDESHGPALELAANALYEHCGWEDEDITNWFGSLVMGAGVSVEFEDEDEE